MKERFKKLVEIKKSKKVDAFLLTSASSVKCFSGYYYNFETGPSPFQLLPAALLIADASSLLIADNETQQLPFVDSSITVSSYKSYVYEEPVESAGQFTLRLIDMFKQAGIDKGRIGVEQNFFPLIIAQSLTQTFPAIEFVDITAETTFLKAIKDSDEVELIRKAANLADIGQAEVLKCAREGMTELELFSKVRLAMETAAGTRVPMMTDLVSGKATASGGGNPTTNIIKNGDLVLSDFTPCLNGYWGDSCNTIVIGKPSSEQQKIFSLVREALEIGLNAIRPGAQAKDVDAAMRLHLEAEGGFGHHGGHGVGTVYHEEPRIVPYNTRILQPGMVIALEPAVYKNDYGIRLEHLAVVTNNGCDILTKFNHCFEQV